MCCCVLIFSVFGPKTAIDEGQNTFLINLFFAKSKILKSDFMFRSQDRFGFFSALADKIAANK